ncbi:MAG TPA: LytTR family DNA-binding domain-containing protein [Prolixibacteraceae bacterium]|nr:LytTR family DNA-binding domain-containing protein [Prolixibacteraceae bacterium]
MSIKCIAVDDEPLAIEKLKSFIERLPQLQLMATFGNASDALGYMQNNIVQIIFLDIRMNGISGLEMVTRLTSKPQVIFTSAYNEYALQAFELAVTDYLLKPYSFDRFCQAVNKAADYLNWQQASGAVRPPVMDYFFVKSGYRLVKIFLNEILYIEGMRDFQSIVTPSSKILASLSFQELEKILPGDFVRCHKSYMVSLSKIESIENDRIRIGNKMIPIGETYKAAFYKHL